METLKDKKIAKLESELLLAWERGMDAQEIGMPSFDMVYTKKEIERIEASLSEQPDTAPTVRDELQDAIQFILDNPNQDDYVNQNWKPQIGNYGEITDDSVELGKFWEKQLKIVIEYLSSTANQPKEI